MTARDNLEMRRLVDTVKTMMTKHANASGTHQLATVSTVSPLTVILDASTVAVPAVKLTSCPPLTGGSVAPSRVVVHVFRQMVLVHGPWE